MGGTEKKSSKYHFVGLRDLWGFFKICKKPMLTPLPLMHCQKITLLSSKSLSQRLSFEFSRRTVELIGLICQLARCKNLEVHQYNRSEIKGVFANFGAETKFQIAKKLTGWFYSSRTEAMGGRPSLYGCV